MAVHIFERSQVIRATPEECWSFFSDPRNLQKITPPSLDFHILSNLPAVMHPGMMICYRVRPLFRIPMTWVTEITQVEPISYFVDEQRVGPYRLWHHEHHFKPLDGGRVEVRDVIHYALPFAPFGELAHGILVAPELRRIFDYREKVVATLWPN